MDSSPSYNWTRHSVIQLQLGNVQVISVDFVLTFLGEPKVYSVVMLVKPCVCGTCQQFKDDEEEEEDEYENDDFVVPDDYCLKMRLKRYLHQNNPRRLHLLKNPAKGQ